MKLSVVTCSYNSEKFIKETLDSVTSQKVSPRHTIEHIILDAFSTDTTIEIVNQYKKETEGRIEVNIAQRPPKGIFNAFNEGVRLTTGDYVLILPSDDFLEPNSLIDYLDFIEKTGHQDLYYAKRNTYNNSTGKNVGGPYPDKWIYFHGLRLFPLGLSCYISQPTVIARRDIHDRFGYYNENLKLVSDWEFYTKLAKNNVSSLFYDRVVSNFRIHEGSATTGKLNPASLGENEEVYVFREYYGVWKYLFIGFRKLYRIIFY